MVNEVFIFAGFGLVGGGVRVLISYLKNSGGEDKIDKKIFMIYALIMLVIGAFSGVVLGYSKTLSFLAGYAGIDLIAGFYKTFMKKKVKTG